jgi:RNA polymerase sigma-70 factor (ECF subfamily)
MTSSTTDMSDARAAELGFEEYRGELTAYCYRMLGSAFEADDAVQETLVRAWRHIEGFERRAALRSWLYRIASNVCFDMLKGRQRRATPVDLTEPGRGDGPVGDVLPEATWLGPIPDAMVESKTDPAEQLVARESVRLAFVAALQHLPPRQRAVLILREVLKWRASEVAELLDTSVPSVNSALQRARATLGDANLRDSRPELADAMQQELLARYVDAFERFDVEAMVALLHEDATMTMPPFPLWMRGADEYGKFMRSNGSPCAGSILRPVAANGAPAFAQWKPSPDGGYDAWAIHVLQLSDDGIAGIDFFVEERLFPLFGMPVHLEAGAVG